MSLELRRLTPPKALVFAICAALLTANSLRSPPCQAEEPTFQPNASTRLSALIELVSKKSAALQQDRLALDLARADARQSRLYENPVLDFTWGTIPIGRTNPSNLDNPMLNVPNYNVGVSYRFLLNKRGPRSDRAEALVRSATSALDYSAHSQAIALARLLGAVASNEVRLKALYGVLEQAKAATQLVKTRNAADLAAGLDVDRLNIEEGRVEQQIRSAESARDSLLSSCPTMTTVPCKSFSSADEARAFLREWIKAGETARGSLETRSDLVALEHAREAATSEGKLARAQAIPDLTVRLGFTHDRFVVSGNQQNSLSLSVAIPLPFFDAGQAQVQGAEAKAMRLELQRKMIKDADHVRLEVLKDTLTRQQRRHNSLVTETLPMAQKVVDDLEKVTTPRLVPVTELIQARRTVSELYGEEADSLGEQFSTAVNILEIQPGQPPNNER